MTYRVVQWTTGNVGKQSVQAIVAHPDLELVGCYAWSADKVGRDVGELCGAAPDRRARDGRCRGVARIEAGLRRLQPYVDRRRRDGAHPRGGREHRHDRGVRHGPFPRCRSSADRRGVPRGGVSVFGTGINPGFASLLAIVSAGVCDRVDKVTVTESADTTEYDSPATELPVGFGAADRRSRIAADDRIGHRGVRGRRSSDR